MIRKIKFAMFLDEEEDAEEEKESYWGHWGLDRIDHIPLAHGTDPEDKDWCNYKRCNLASEILVKGYGYCDAHFAKEFCDSPDPEDKTEIKGVQYSTFRV